MYNIKLILVTYPGHMINEKNSKKSYDYVVLDFKFIRINYDKSEDRRLINNRRR